MSEFKLSKAEEFKQWVSERQGHPFYVKMGIESVKELERELEKLRKELIEIKDQNEWKHCRKMTSDMFVDGYRILCINKKLDYVFESEYDDGIWCNIGGDDFDYWKEIPELPKVELNKQNGE